MTMLSRSLLLAVLSTLLWSGAHGFSSSAQRPPKAAESVLQKQQQQQVEALQTQLPLQQQQQDELVVQDATPLATTTTTPTKLFLSKSEILQDCNWAGNLGFDPLGLASTHAQLLHHREAEIKHARLAMLAAAGLPLSDLFDREVDAFFGFKFLESDQWHRFLDRAAPAFWGSCLGLIAVVELESAARSRDDDTDYVPGKLGFDPLKLFPQDATAQQTMLTAEITHGRVAMIAMGIYLLQEYALSTSESSLLNAVATALEYW